MLSRLLLLGLLFTSCQRGLIPCPEVEVVRFKERSAYKQKPVMMARKEEPEEKTNWKRPKEKTVQNVSIEEWDCPRPGKKKYMPRAVKQNIRKNERKIHSVDSLHSSPFAERK